jgi:DNA polymerase III sliding clamp (beta) subunit (PCNA family)
VTLDWSIKPTSDRQDEPYKFTVIGKDLQDVSLTTSDFLVHDGQMTFISTDKEGVLRLVDFDPAGKLIINFAVHKLM